MIGSWFRRAPLGRRGERIAARRLRRWGYVILEKNAKIGPYEIDIIAREGDTVAFVEVKTRRAADLAAPEENVTRTKQRHIRAAARRYIGRHGDPDCYYRFDIVSVVLPERGKPAVTLYRDAFQDE